jgi:hypothetical protein
MRKADPPPAAAHRVRKVTHRMLLLCLILVRNRGSLRVHDYEFTNVVLNLVGSERKQSVTQQIRNTGQAHTPQSGARHVTPHTLW